MHVHRLSDASSSVNGTRTRPVELERRRYYFSSFAEAVHRDFRKGRYCIIISIPTLLHPKHWPRPVLTPRVSAFTSVNLPEYTHPRSVRPAPSSHVTSKSCAFCEFIAPTANIIWKIKSRNGKLQSKRFSIFLKWP